MLVITHVRRNMAIIAVTLMASLPFPETAEAGNEGRPPRIGSYQHPHRSGHYQDHRAGHYQDHRNDSGAGRPPGPRDPGYQNPYMPGSTAQPPRGPTVSSNGAATPPRGPTVSSGGNPPRGPAVSGAGRIAPGRR